MISSKVGRVLRRPSKPGPFQRDSDWIGGLEFAHDMDYSYDGVMRSFEDSLQRLGINRIDVLLIHDLDTWHFKTEAKVAPYWNQLATSGWRALESLRDQGVIKGIGAGFNTMGTIPKYLDFFDMDFFLIAMRYTLLEQDVLDAEFPACAERGVGIVIGGGLTIPASWPPAPCRARATIMRPPARRCWRASPGWRRCASATASRSSPPRCNSRSAIPSSPRSFPARSPSAR